MPSWKLAYIPMVWRCCVNYCRTAWIFALGGNDAFMRWPTPMVLAGARPKVDGNGS